MLIFLLSALMFEFNKLYLVGKISFNEESNNMDNTDRSKIPSDVFTYSQIIEPIDYNRIMSEQHLYISASDKFLGDVISKKIANSSSAHIVELGCGPGRILPLVRKAVPYANIAAIEADEIFANYANILVQDLAIKIIIDDVEYCQLGYPIDIFYSQGFHHHVSKERKTHAYLKNIYDQLIPGGFYILSDEFLPDYKNENEREDKAIIWYSHIIANALLHGYYYLAFEEAKTLLDDIYEGRTNTNFKNNKQIDFVVSQVSTIDSHARSGNKTKLAEAVAHFKKVLETYHNMEISDDITVGLSRHDYKICENVLRSQVESVGFIIEEIKSFGPIENIGAMSVYVLRK